MDHISKILPKILQKRGLAGHAGAAFVIFNAELWMKEQMGSLPLPTFTMGADRVLVIGVKHGIVAQELQGRLPELQSFLEGACAGEAPRSIRIGRMRESRLA